MKKKNALILGAVSIVLIIIAGLYFSQNTGYADETSKILFFYSDNCDHCFNQKIVLSELANEGFRIKPMNVDEHPEYFQQYNFTGTPIFIAQDGARKIGFTEKNELKTWLLLHGGKIG
ncbi:MAG: thioredoxin family protein [Candidatus Micrarchaeota archaeon]